MLFRSDIVGLVEAAQMAVDQEEAQRQQEKLAQGKFDLNDFRQQIVQMKKMGSVKEIMGAMPGMSGMIPEDEDPEKALTRIQGMIDAMTRDERTNPDVIDISRRRRIATGSGCEPHEVKQFLQQFDGIRNLMRQMMNMSMWERIKMVTGLGKAGAFDPGSNFLQQKAKGDTGHRKTAKERAEERKKKKKKK